MVDKPINIQLGDIIQIISQPDDKFNENIFLVKYIDNTKITIININTKDESILYISDGILDDTDITELILLSRSEFSGYAMQNQLTPKTWVNIYFKGDIPFIITGEIISLDEDMIEIKTYPDNDIIYIDFAYKGIPQDLPIEKIIIRSSPDSINQVEDLQEEDLVDKNLDIDLDQVNDSDNVQQVQDIIVDADEIEFGEELDEITQIVDVPEEEQRFGIDKQTNDLLDELLSKIPNSQRTPQVLNDIHRSIQRFKQLRKIYSIYDSNGNISMAKIHGPNYKPIVEVIQKFKQKLYWLLPVVTNKRKIYDLEIEDENLEDNDIDSLKLITTLNEELDIIETYKNNSIVNDESKYKILLKSLNPYLTPFTSPDNPQNNVINSTVDNNINVITNNLDNFYSSVAGEECCPSKSRFVSQMLNSGITYKNNLIVQPDQISLKSFMILPKQVAKFSLINSPVTNILDKTDLNLNYLSYWKFLNDKTNVDTSVIESFTDKTKNPEVSNFLSGIKEYILDEELNNNTQDNYKQYIENIIPNITELFEITRENKYNNLSLKNLVDQLSPFMVFIPDLSIDEYSHITNYIKEQVDNYKKKYESELKKIKQVILKTKTNKPINNLLTILKTNPELEKIVLDNYNFSPDNTYSDSEILDHIFKLDKGRLYFSILLKMDIELRGANIVEKFINDYEQLSENEKNIYLDKKNQCYIITNKYSDRLTLQKDNNKTIFVDNEYLNEKERADAYQKPVEEGNIAILLNPDGESEYYIRKKNKWLIDAKIIKENITITDNKLFCNFQNKCINDSEPNQCIPIKSLSNNITKDDVNSIINEFDSSFSQEQNILVKKIDSIIENNIQQLSLLKLIQEEQFLKYNSLYNKIGSTIENVEQISSPYEILRDVILGQTDFVKKQYDIQKFCVNFTRLPFEKENHYWLYCSKTNIKLIPLFISELANTFISKGDYLLHLDKVCADQGTISDDGDNWVDKHSGYIIKSIDLDTEEGFTEEGYKLKTRDILEKELADAVLLGGPSLKKTDSPERKLITNIVKSMTQFMSINLDKEYDFIIKNVMLIHDASIPSQNDYEKVVKRAQERGKKNIETYNETVNTSYLFLSLTFILIAIQVSVPPIKSKKTFPGCIRSFDGYPLLSNGDKSGLFYISCVANKIKSSTEPWNTIKKNNESTIAKRIETIIDTYVLKNAAIKERFIEKINYLKENKQETILLEKDYDNIWINFLPPLIPVSLPKLINVSDIFRKQLLDNIHDGSSLQYNQILSLKSKIIFFSLSIQEHIQKIVSKKTALITNATNEPFLENSCCDTDNINILSYFTDLIPAILNDNDIVVSISDILYDINILAKAPFFFDPRDTKLRNPDFTSGFSEDTIYRAFIIYCKYNNNIVLSEELREICMAKPDDFNIEYSIQQKIDLLKDKGIKYDEENLQQLLQYINYENRVSLNLDTPSINNIEILRDILINIRELPLTNHNIDIEFTDLFIKLLDTFSISVKNDDNNELRNMKNYLGQKNIFLYNKIIDFIKSNSKLPKQKFSNLQKCLDNISDFDIDDSIHNKDNHVNKMVTFIRNTINDFTNTFPNIIINEVDNSNISIPRHWELSERHILDVKDIVKKHYAPLKVNYGEKELLNSLNLIQKNSSYINSLAFYTEYLSAIHNNDVTITSVLDEKVISLLFKFYFLNVINNYIELTETTAILEPIPEDPDIVEQEEVLQDLQGEIDDFEIVRGEKLELQSKISKLIVSYMEIVCNTKEYINYNYKTIMDKILRSKEKEKDTFTSALKDLTDEEREIENLFKNNKLEKWGKGLQKGLTQYVKDTYDDEREQMEQQAIKDLHLSKKKGVVDGNKDIYLLDIDHQDQLDREIDEEVNNLDEYLGEDYDGELDGDEFF